MKKLKGVIAMAITLACAYPAHSQDTNPTSIPDQIYEQHLDIGFGSSYEPAIEMYTPLVQNLDVTGIATTKDLPYGTHERHLLDVYQPEEGEQLPVAVFVHGGGYVSGDRDVTAQFYGNIPIYFAQQGFLGISATYRLAPDAQWPSGGEDVAAIVDWVKQNAESYGGDPDRIFLIGHSAGATHVATYVFDPRFQPDAGHGVDGAILVSGRYDVAFDMDDPDLDTIRAYWGTDESLYKSRSPINRVENSSVPVMIVVAEFESRSLVATSGQLFAALCDRDRGRCPRFVQAQGHNHLSEVTHIGTTDEDLGREIVEFMHQGADLRAEWTAAS